MMCGEKRKLLLFMLLGDVLFEAACREFLVAYLACGFVRVLLMFNWPCL
jgi:hypothetical protein